MQIVAINGGFCSGKSTLAEKIQTYYGPNWLRTGFAVALKKEVLRVLNEHRYPSQAKRAVIELIGTNVEGYRDPRINALLRKYVEDYVHVTAHLEAWEIMGEIVETDANKGLLRILYQDHGTAMREVWTPDYWVKLCLNNAEAQADKVLIDDLRYPNELTGLREYADETGCQLLTIRLYFSDPRTQRSRYESKYGPQDDATWERLTSHVSENSLGPDDDFDIGLAAETPPSLIYNIVSDSMERRGFIR